VIRVGTSGWQYADWRERFYPRDVPQREWLAFFARRFATTEVNNSFYRLPAEGVFARWRDVTPPGFVMAVKASRFLTHMRRLREPEEPVQRLWSRATELGDRLGPILFQLPPRFPADAGRLSALLDTLPAPMRPAFEFRDPSWHTASIFDLLSRRDAPVVWADRPGARIGLPLTASWSYLRFHQGRTTAPGYTREKLRRWAERIAALAVEDTYVYFNNDPGGAAVRDARTLIELLRELGAPVAPAPPAPSPAPA
jgi:uncharacterized protein YecE (DUF72 family)